MYRFSALALLLTLLILGRSGKAQNLVLNPSFESVNISSLQCSWYTSQGQFNAAINNWTCPTGGSTDVYHTSLPTSCFSSPQSTNASAVGQQNPRTGNSFVNLVTYGNGGCSPYREYVQGRLSSPLIAGQAYQIEMYVTLADYCNKGTNNIGVRFTTAPVTSTSMCVYSATPDVNYTGPIIIDKTNWTLISMCFTPTVSGLEYLMIGNFYDDAATSTVATGGSQSTIRYFLDDVSVTPATAGSVDPGTNGTLSVCSGAPTVDLFTLLGGTPDQGGTWTGPSSLTGGYLGTYDPAVNTAGTYTYTVGSVICGNPATGSSTVTVSINNNSVASINSSGPYCETGSAVQLTAATAGGTWSATCGSCISAAGVFDPSIAGQGIHQVTYVIPGACGDTGTTTISVTSSLDATITPVSALCESSSPVTLNAADPGGAWNSTCTGCVSSSGILDPAIAGPGNYWISYNITGTCGDRDSIQVQILPQADAAITAQPSLCTSSQPVMLNAADPGGNWGATCGSCIVSSTGEFNPSTAGPGTHTVSYSIGGQCGSTDTEIIIVNPQRDATITSPGTLCVNDNPLIISSAESGGTWSSSCVSCISSTGSFDPSAAGAGNHWVTYNITTACGDIDSIQVQVIAPPEPTISAVSTVCISSSSVALNAASPGGIWNASCGSCINVNTGEFDPSVAGTGTHTVTYVIGGQCGSSDTEQIQVSGLLDATISSVAPLCKTEPAITLTAATTGGMWSASCISCISSSGTFDPSIAGPGTHSITYITAGSCGDTSTVQVTVNDNLNASITPVSPVCPGATPITLSALTAGGTWSGTGITNSTDGTFDPAVAGSGTFEVIYTIAGSCGDADTATIIVIPAVTALASDDQSVCEGQSSLLSVSASGGDGNYSYTWNDQWGSTIGSQQQVTVSPGATETYTVNIVDGCGSSATETITVNITQFPDASFTATPVEGCVSLSVTFTAQNTYNGYCTWKFGNGDSSIACNTASFIFDQPRCYDISYTVEVNGCRDSVLIPDLVCASAMPSAAFTVISDTLSILDPNADFINSSEGSDLYLWTFGDGSESELEHVSHTYNGIPASYKVCLEASTVTGCVDSTCKYLVIDDEFLVYVPNAFSPDNNGRNDQFMPVISGHLENSYEMSIYNRWGNLVFSTKDVLKGWDGKDAQEDVYVWKLIVTSRKDNQLRKMQGTVTIVR